MKVKTQRKAGAAAVASAFLLVAAIVVTTANASTASAATCSAVQFIGARGSNEPVGFGVTINTTLTEFKNRATKSVSAYALVYPASPQPFGNDSTILQFKASVETGTANLVAYLKAQSAKCPSQRFVLAGYSQGALVVDRALNLSSASIVTKVVAVTLFGDPRFDPKFVGNAGNYNKTEEGIIRWLLPNYGGSQYLPAALTGKAQSYCISRDPICNYSFSNAFRCLWILDADSCPHARYDNAGYTGKAGWFLASKANV